MSLYNRVSMVALQSPVLSTMVKTMMMILMMMMMMMAVPCKKNGVLRDSITRQQQTLISKTVKITNDHVAPGMVDLGLRGADCPRLTH